MYRKRIWTVLAAGGLALAVAALSEVMAQPQGRQRPGAPGRAMGRAARGQAFEGLQTDPELRALRQDVALLGLVRRLHLTKEQLGQVVGLLANYAQTQDRFEADISKARSADRDVLNQIRNSLLRGEEPSPELRKQAEQVMAEAGPRIREFMETRQRAASAIADVLTEEQVASLPGRGAGCGAGLGREGAREAVAGFMVLQRVRRMSDEDYRTHRDQIIASILQRHDIPEAKRSEVSQRLGELLDRIRGMSDEEFRKNLPQLGDQARDLLGGPAAAGRRQGQREGASPRGLGPGRRWRGGAPGGPGGRGWGQGAPGNPQGRGWGQGAPGSPQGRGMMLQRIRQTSDEEYRANRDKIIERMLQRPGIPEEIRREAAPRLGALLDRVRALPESELQQSLPQLGEQFRQILGTVVSGAARAAPRLMIANRLLAGDVRHTIDLLKKVEAQGGS